jgi:Flp pilus assembly protein TadD
VRLLFPRRPGLQLAGLLLAAFLPMQLYLAHYVTNETLAATLGSASLYLALRLARYPRGSTVQYALFGLIAGAALLTKATALLLIPPLFLMLGAKLWSGQEPAGASICKFLVATVVMLLVGGWYYVRLWTRFGSPLVGNWDAASGFSWWQDPGYHVAADYGRFGQSLVAPFFSSLNGFLDGIYSTLWGDGLAGGAADIAHRIPWNSAIMVCGYLWAMLPTILILGGAAVAVRRFVRTPSLEYFLLLTTAAAVCFGVVLMTLKVACFGQVKAFYGLSAVIPVCVFGAIGWDVMTRGRRRLQFVFAVLLVAFAINSFASVWILPTPQRHLFAARRFQIIHQSDAALRQVEQAVASDPSRSEAHALLSSVLEEMNHPEQAFREAELAVELGPREVGAHLRLGFVQADRGNLEAALAEARAALALGPENPVAYDLLLFCLSRLPEVDEEMLSTTRDALTVSPFNPFLHQALGLACARRSDFGGALSQFAYAAVISPNWHDPRMQFQTVLSNLGVDAQATRHLEEAAAIAHDSPLLLNDLAWLRATSPEAALRDGGQAVAMAERACRLTNRENANLLVTLAASYAEAGRFADAINIADQALQLAGQTHEDATGERAANLVAEFRANHPYREKAASIYH